MDGSSFCIEVKAHCIADDIVIGNITLEHLQGNAMADTWAGKGADINEVPWTKRVSIIFLTLLHG